MTYAELTTPWDRVREHYSMLTLMRTAHAVTGLLIALATWAVLFALITPSLLLVWTLIVPIVGVPLLLWAIPLLTAVQRARFSALLDVDIPPVPRPARQRNPLKWLLVRMRSGSTWRQFCYHLLSLPIAVASFGVVVGIWCGALISLASAAAVQARGETELAVALAVLGTALLAAGPWPARWLASLDVLAARALLGPSRAEELAQRVESLRESRAEVVDAADAERRRIERDLHDGAQQRLVSLAMNLGMARAGLKDLPEPAREVIAQAHEEAKQALKELRDLVRGLHPAVLSEEGLDAALSGLAARAPLPVRLTVDAAGRASPTVEAVAFFVVSEALANVAKHSGASGAEVSVLREVEGLRVTIRDDGRGGADPARGTGLRGLAQRVRSVDGVLTIDSPAGGPTTIEAVLPCG